jgi:multiple sugar transport system permease protein
MKGLILVNRSLMYFLLFIVAGLTTFPFYWMFILATQTPSEIFRSPPRFWFGQGVTENYRSLVQALPSFWRNMWNSVYIAIMATITNLFFCSLAGYAFAMYDFKYKNLFFSIMMATMMIPPLLGIIPYYIMMSWLGWIDKPRALYVPSMASAFGIFLLRQYIASAVPRELMDAARIDGCSEFRIYWNIVLPLIKPGLAPLGIVTFVGSWNNLLGALVVLRSREAYTLPVALRTLQGLYKTDWGAIMLGTALSVLPILIVFIFGSHRVIQAFVAGTGLKQ